VNAPQFVCESCNAPLEDHVTAGQIARVFKCNRSTVYKMIYDGRLGAFQLNGAWRICPPEVQRYARDNHNLLGKECT